MMPVAVPEALLANMEAPSAARYDAVTTSRVFSMSMTSTTWPGSQGWSS